MSIYTVHEPPLKARRSGARSRALRLRARRLLVLGLPAGAAVDAAASAVAGVHRLRHRRHRAVRSRCVWSAPRRAVTVAVAVLLVASGRLRGGDAAALHAGAPRLEECRHRRRRRSSKRPSGGSSMPGSTKPGPTDRRSTARRVRRRPQRACRWRAGPHPRSSACFRSRERRGDRRHRRLRLGQSAFGGEGVRARRARGRTRRSRSW